MPDKLVLINQYGEESINYVGEGTDVPFAGPIGDQEVLANISGDAAAPVGVAIEDLPPAMLLTGFSAGAGTVSATDSVGSAIEKLAGNSQNRAVTANLLTGLAAGTNSTILDTDTVPKHLQNFKHKLTRSKNNA